MRVHFGIRECLTTFTTSPVRQTLVGEQSGEGGECFVAFHALEMQVIGRFRRICGGFGLLLVDFLLWCQSCQFRWAGH